MMQDPPGGPLTSPWRVSLEGGFSLEGSLALHCHMTVSCDHMTAWCASKRRAWPLRRVNVYLLHFTKWIVVRGVYGIAICRVHLLWPPQHWNIGGAAPRPRFAFDVARPKKKHDVASREWLKIHVGVCWRSNKKTLWLSKIELQILGC